MAVAKKVKKAAASEIGSFFRAKRLEAGVTDAATAAYLGCAPETFSQFESGERALPLNAAYALANFLNIEPDEVLKLFSASRRA